MTLSLSRKMLAEAIALLVLEGTFNTESTARRVIKENVLMRDSINKNNEK